ncbi:MAG: winged helix-turn-helix transcriptional regulator, partial [Clostridiales bacterium]|nr:winged helix-turn-helix transcriptional regulator [Clostridiales bacterium]
AVCHRSYFEKGARIMVEIFDDRVDVTSPGGVCKGITEENFGTVSITRNPIVVSMFFRIEYIEQMGTGITRMRNAAREANVAEPEFRLADFFKATFKRPPTDGSSNGNTSVNTSVNTSQNTSVETSLRTNVALTAIETEVFNCLIADPYVKISDIAAKLGKSRSTVSDRVQALKKKRVIIRVGSDKTGHWEVVEGTK